MITALKNCIEVIESGKREKGGAVSVGIPSIGAEHLLKNGRVNWAEQSMKYISEDFFDTMKAGKIQPCDVLLVKDGATTGKVAYVDAVPQSGAAINEHVFLMRPKDSLLPKYLYFYLHSPIGKNKVLHFFRGAAIGGISRDFLNAEIKLPSISVQEEIIRKLSCIDDVVQICQQMKQEYDNLVKSRFIEMFFNITDDTKWEKAKIVDVCEDTRTGPFGSSLHHDEFVDEGIFVLGIDNAVENKFSYNRMRYITPEKYEQLKRYTVKPKDVIITIMGTVGRSAVIPDDMPTAINTKHLACLTPKQEMIDSHFLAQAFQIHPEIRGQLAAQTKGAIMDGLNLTIIKNLTITVPPLPLQKEYVSFLSQADKSKLIIDDMISENEVLRTDVMQQYFF